MSKINVFKEATNNWLFFRDSTKFYNQLPSTENADLKVLSSEMDPAEMRLIR
jgi:hypothetical protein